MPNTDPYHAIFTIPEKLHVDELSFDGNLVTIHASTGNPAAECPCCEQPSRRIHSCYTRTLADLPWCGTPVRACGYGSASSSAIPLPASEGSSPSASRRWRGCAPGARIARGRRR
jgi:hypothetical protein